MDYFSQFEELKSKGLSLDLTRGKPSSDQLDLSNDLTNFTNNDFSFDGIDLRNYGEIKGLDSCRELGAEILGCSKELIFFLFCMLKEMVMAPGILKKEYQSYVLSLVMTDTSSYARHLA